jgi:hypothetical protein
LRRWVPGAGELILRVDAALVLPPGSTGYRLTAHTSSGNMNTRMPTSPGSSHVITVTTQSGDITVIR